jgi:hypothetical protein
MYKPHLISRPTFSNVGFYCTAYFFKNLFLSPLLFFFFKNKPFYRLSSLLPLFAFWFITMQWSLVDEVQSICSSQVLKK